MFITNNDYFGFLIIKFRLNVNTVIVGKLYMIA